jgi:hypothetical protein
MTRTGFIIILVLSLICGWSLAYADDGFYVIAAGKRAKRTVLVSPRNTQTESGTALLNALDKITGASESNPYLVIIEPGVYDIGENALQMKSYVDIQGSGENVTKIKGNIEGNTTGVVEGADNAELRYLTVENVGGGTDAVAICNVGVSPRLSNVTVTASGSTYNTGIYNSGFSGIMTHITAKASGGTNSYGIRNYDSSSATMNNAFVEASGGTHSNYGVYNNTSSTLKIHHSVISGSASVEVVSGTVYVAHSKLVGMVNGICTCASVCDGNYNFYTNYCP